MKKILLVLLIVGAFSACTSSEKKAKKIEMETKVHTLNDTVYSQIQEYESLKAETRELNLEIQELNSLINIYKN